MSIGIVGKDIPYNECVEDEIARYLSMIEGEERRGAPASSSKQVPSSDDGSENPPPDPVPTVAMETE